MKYLHSFVKRPVFWSPPSRGAWIEIISRRTAFRPGYCRPPRGGRGLKSNALMFSRACACWSPPSRGRGLKCLRRTSTYAGRRVAPLAGAWIEMARAQTSRPSLARSPPSRGRGLKWRVHRLLRRGAASPPPSRGAWIEMMVSSPALPLPRVAPLAGGVD